MKILMDNLQRLLTVLKSSLVAIKIIEIVLVIAIGIVTNKITSDNNSSGALMWILIILAGFYIGISVLQLTALFIPSRIVDELKARLQLTSIQSDLERKTEIYDYLADAIGKLNVQTCNLNYLTDSDAGRLQYFCDKGLTETLSNAIEPLLINTNYVFQCNKTKYTVGVYLNYYLKTPDWKNLPIDSSSLNDKGIILLKDHLNLSSLFTKDLIDNPTVSGEKLSIKHAIETAFNNCTYNYVEIKVMQKIFSMFSIGIPTVCEDGAASGVLFFIVERIKEPSDIGQILNVFSKIITNLLSRHIECLNSKIFDANLKHRTSSQENISRTKTPPEVSELPIEQNT